MKKEKQRLTEWAEEHKEELIGAAAGLAVGIAGVLVFKNWGSIRMALGTACLPDAVSGSAWKLPTKVAENAAMVAEEAGNATLASNKAPHIVSAHIRNLPDGFSASPAKVALAAANGFNLEPGQTWVRLYQTGLAA